ncbi:MAG: Bug family tripartite tricarboxylate transporter substrate binding protein [Burkholderiales bacterium]
MPIERSCIHSLIATSVLLGAAGPGAAQTYPTRPVTLVVSTPAGSFGDIVGRAIANGLAPSMGQPMVVENRPGAGGIIAAEHVRKSVADGQTLLVASMAIPVFNSYVFSKLPYDPSRDFANIGTVFTGPVVVVVRASLGVNTLAELIALAKSKPGTLNLAHAGNGTPPHIAAALLLRTAGVQMTQVPFKGSNDSVQAVVAGTADVCVDAPPLVAPHVRSGRLKALAVTGPERVPMIADVPTTAEAGLAAYRSEFWFGLLAPAATPKPIVQRVNAELQKLVASAEMRQFLDAQGARPLALTPEAFDALIKKENEHWGPVLREAGIRLD